MLVDHSQTFMTVEITFLTKTVDLQFQSDVDIVLFSYKTCIVIL